MKNYSVTFVDFSDCTQTKIVGAFNELEVIDFIKAEYSVTNIVSIELSNWKPTWVR